MDSLSEQTWYTWKEAADITSFRCYNKNSGARAASMKQRAVSHSGTVSAERHWTERLWTGFQSGKESPGSEALLSSCWWKMESSEQLVTESQLISLYCRRTKLIIIAALQLLLHVPKVSVQQKTWVKPPSPVSEMWWSPGRRSAGGTSGDLQEQACRKVIWAGNKDEIMRIVLKWIETCSHSIDLCFTPSLLPPPLWLMVRGWWRGKWWAFTPLSWSLTADRMISVWWLEVKLWFLLSLYFLTEHTKWDKYEENIFQLFLPPAAQSLTSASSQSGDGWWRCSVNKIMSGF